MTTSAELRAAFSHVLTDRLALRAVSQADVDAAYAIHGDPATYEFHPAGVAGSREESTAQIERWERAWQEVGLGVWAVSRRDDPRVIGFGGLSQQIWQDRSVLNAYYRFEPGAWGRGYATEMASAAVALAKALLPDMPIIVRTRPGNSAAQAVAMKLGLHRAPFLDDHMLTYVSQWER